MRLAFIAISMFGAVAGTACGSGGDTSADAAIDCSTVTGVDTFTVGLEKDGVGGKLAFKLMSMDPAPPVRSDANSWVVEVDSMSAGVVGAPLAGADLVLTPYMPAHMHGPGEDPIMSAGPSAGQFKIDRINTWMPGVWQMTFSVSTPTADRAVYNFCINP